MHKNGYLSASPTGLATSIDSVYGPIHELSPTPLESKSCFFKDSFLNRQVSHFFLTPLCLLCGELGESASHLKSTV
jgi:hypothetical protein